MHREDLSKLPLTTKDYEVNLHGGFAIDQLNGGQIYYGMPGCGAMRVGPCTSSKQVGQNRGLETEQSGCLPAQVRLRFAILRSARLFRFTTCLRANMVSRLP